MPGTATQAKRRNVKKKPADNSRYSGRVANRVREVREAAGMDMDTFVAMLNKKLAKRGKWLKPLRISTAYGWENGNGNIHPDYYPFVADVLGVSVHELLPKK